MMLIMLAGLQSQPGDIREAANVDGANGIGIFRQLTLPHLRPYLELGALLGSIYIVQAFDAIDVMTGGGPGSTNVPYYVYQASIGGGFRYGAASAYALVVVVVSTLIVLLLALPAAYALAIQPIHKWRDVLFFFSSTKFLPIVASIVPVYVYAEKWNLIGTRTVLSVLYIAINLPLAIWMTRSFFMEVPRELIEAAEIDGTSFINQLRQVILPISAPGIAATALLCVIFAWNEYFYALQLNFANASTMPQWVVSNLSTRGNFLAKLSAASVIACLPVVIAGWAAQKRLVRGLSMGALK